MHIVNIRPNNKIIFKILGHQKHELINSQKCIVGISIKKNTLSKNS